jgi:hypothetical protein
MLSTKMFVCLPVLHIAFSVSLYQKMLLSLFMGSGSVVVDWCIIEKGRKNDPFTLYYKKVNLIAKSLLGRHAMSC